MSVNHELSDLFANLAAIMEIKGENPFKAISFHKVSRILKDLPEDVKTLSAEGKLADVEGIGDRSRKIIEDYLRDGRSVDYDEAAASVPAGLLGLLTIPGMGPKTIALLWKERKITSREELVKALADGSLAGLRGIGDKKIELMKQGLAMQEQASKRIGIVEAETIAQAMLQRVRGLPQVKQAEIAGSLRRRRETIGDLDLLCSLKNESDGKAVAEAFTSFPQVQHINAKGSTKSSIVTAEGLQVDLRMVPPESFGAAWLYFTGSKEHNVRLRGRAIEKGMTLNEWGLYRGEKSDKGESLAGRTEAEVYRKLGLPYIEPELREDRGEIDAALAGRLPELIQLSDIRGDLHCHTTASDGTASIEQMAQAAVDRGYEYLAITDHSKSSVIANGLSADRLAKHIEQIHRVAARFKKHLKLLAGCEVDILADGHLDFEDSVLAELDIVIASPHVALRQDTVKSTDRLLRAIDNPYVNVIGHPTGRLIGSRPGLPLDFPKIFAAAAKSGVAMEINAGWPRLDLDDVHARAAIDAGVNLSIDTDAHSTDGLAAMPLGIGVARRAWVSKQNVINCWPFERLSGFIRKKRP